MEDKLMQYPCVKIGEIYHVTVTGSKCACGRVYDYTRKTQPKDTGVTRSPLRWLTLTEITCDKCREITEEKDLADN